MQEGTNYSIVNIQMSKTLFEPNADDLFSSCAEPSSSSRAWPSNKALDLIKFKTLGLLHLGWSYWKCKADDLGSTFLCRAQIFLESPVTLADTLFFLFFVLLWVTFFLFVLGVYFLFLKVEFWGGPTLRALLCNNKTQATIFIAPINLKDLMNKHRPSF